jgi:acetyl/propionyl-CoA carboxylase alpha subunit
LIEQVHGIDLLRAQYEIALGRKLHWKQPSGEGLGYGIQVRLYHSTVVDRKPAQGTLERLDLPDDCHVERGVDEGTVFGSDTEPLLARITVVEADRRSAIHEVRRILDAAKVTGIPTNLEVLRHAFHSDSFADDTHGPGLMGALVLDPLKSEG